MAVFSTLFYFFVYTTTYQNIESKLQEISKKYPTDTSLNGAIVLDSKITTANFEKQIHTNRIEYILQIPFKDTGLQITQDITQEVKLLRFLALSLVVLNFTIWIMAVLLVWQNRRNEDKLIRELIIFLNTLKVDELNKFANPNQKFLEQSLQKPLVLAFKGFFERVEAYYQAKKQLYSGIAHELKTPLAVIKTRCEVTLLKARESEAYINALKENIQSVNVAQTSIKALFNLIQNSDKTECAQLINIQRELENLIKDFTLLSKDRKFEYVLQTEGLEILIKPALLRLILQNFLQNAFKFTPKDKAVCLKSFVKNGILEIEVLDEGEGIKADSDIFAPFEKVGNQEGIGLGLFLAKKAAEELGGEITLENRKDKQGVIAAFKLELSA